MTKPLRESMPSTAAFLDACLEAFGKDAVQPSIRAGMAGCKRAFYAVEAGQQVGTYTPPPAKAITLDKMVLRDRATDTRKGRGK